MLPLCASNDVEISRIVEIEVSNVFILLTMLCSYCLYSVFTITKKKPHETPKRRTGLLKSSFVGAWSKGKKAYERMIAGINPRIKRGIKRGEIATVEFFNLHI